MGKKYIIELNDECNSEFKGIMVFGLTQEKQISVELIPEESLRPYTEPDMEQVKRDYDAWYEKGLADAWEAARKIANMPYGEEEKVFGSGGWAFITNHTASEAIEKIRQYEQEKEEIRVGDEIETPSGLRGYVVNFTDDELVHYVSSEGRFGTMGTSAVSKTGRHFPEIAEVLAKMKKS